MGVGLVGRRLGGEADQARHQDQGGEDGVDHQRVGVPQPGPQSSHTLTIRRPGRGVVGPAGQPSPGATVGAAPDSLALPAGGPHALDGVAQGLVRPPQEIEDHGQLGVAVPAGEPLDRVRQLGEGLAQAPVPIALELDDDLAPVGGIGRPADEARLRQPIDDARDGPRGEPHVLGQPAGGEGPGPVEDVEALPVGRVEPDQLGTGVVVEGGRRPQTASLPAELGQQVVPGLVPHAPTFPQSAVRGKARRPRTGKEVERATVIPERRVPL